MSKYIAKQPNDQGLIDWTPTEDNTWHTLYTRQIKIIENRACDAYIEGVKRLAMPTDRVPQLTEVNEALNALTGWSVVPVPAMITPTQFFELLKNKQFPAATFIRTEAEIDYLQEPDIFHELFGHCPMITHQPFADFMQRYGEIALGLEHRKYLARLFWFTVEFGLIQTQDGPKCYGGGILSSKDETVYAVESSFPKRKKFDLMDVLRTPYRVDQMQGTYFVLDTFDELTALLDLNLAEAIDKARAMPEYELIEVEPGADKDEWITC